MAVIVVPGAAIAKKKTAHKAAPTRRECHFAALKKYPNPRSAAHQDAMARCMAGKKI
jgi:hypothetical protein